MDVLTGDGRVVTATPDGEHRDLFYGFPNSYGTLGYALRLRIELEPVTPYVHLRHVRFTERRGPAPRRSARSAPTASGTASGSTSSTAPGSPPTSATSRSATCADDGAARLDYTGQQIYYRSIQHRSEDWLTTHDYLWRWDTDWFWCSRAFGAQNPRIRRVWPKRWRRSDVYWKLIALEDRYHIKARIDARHGKPAGGTGHPGRRGAGRSARGVHRVPRRAHRHRAGLDVPAAPARPDAPLGPVRTSTPPRSTSTSGSGRPRRCQPGETDGFHNRAIEEKVSRARRAQVACTPPRSTRRTSSGRRTVAATYELLKKTYDPNGRLLDLYAKTVQRR